MATVVAVQYYRGELSVFMTSIYIYIPYNVHREYRGDIRHRRRDTKRDH